MNTIILIHGKGFGTGKDTVGRMISNQINQRNPQRKVFCFRLAEQVKLWAQNLSGMQMQTVKEDHSYNNEIIDFTHEQKETHLRLWNMTLGQMLQKLATEACRDNFDEEIWIKMTAKKIANVINNDPQEDNTFIVPDFRFINEAHISKFVTQITDQPCITNMIKVVREVDNYSSRDINHRSETELDHFIDWTYVIKNDNTLTQLRYLCQTISDEL